MNYGYITVASAIPQVRVADVDYNVEQIERFVVDADKRGVEILVFPELSVTGYSCQDLFAQQALLDRVEKKIVDMLEATERCDVISVVGAPICIGGGVYNCAVVCQHGKVLGIVPKRFLPNYGEFYEKRWFASSDDLTESVVIGYAGSWVSVSGEETLFKTARGVKFGIELCEDVWSPLPPSTDLVLILRKHRKQPSASSKLLIIQIHKRIVKYEERLLARIHRIHKRKTHTYAYQVLVTCRHGSHIAKLPLLLHPY